MLFYTESDVARAAEFAYLQHKGQKYGEKDYFYHLSMVASVVECMTLLESNTSQANLLKIVAYLHDTIEDTETTKEELEKLFDVRVASAVVALSKVKNQSYDDYMLNVLSNSTAHAVKIADTKANLMQSQMDGNQKRIDKYQKQLDFLLKEWWDATAN